MWWRAQQQKVDHSNVNADWDETTNSVVPGGTDDKSSQSIEDVKTAAV
jgi:PiT family inorganic phosphate transporter